MKFPDGSFDFHYDTTKFIALRIDPYIETLNPSGKSQELEFEKYYDELDANSFPSTLLILLPFTFFEPMTANLLWCICNVFFSLGIVWLIKCLYFDKLYTGSNPELIYAIFIAIFFTGTPFRNNIGNGQQTLLVFFFCLLSIWLSENNHRILAGISLALSCLKYVIAVPMALYYIYKHKYKEILITMIWHIILNFIVAIWLNASPIDLILMPLKIYSKLSSQGLYDICSLLNIQSVTVSIILFILMTAFICYCRKKVPNRDSEVISMLIMFSLAFVYHRIYDYFVLIIPLIVIMTSNRYSLFEKAITCLCVSYIFFIHRISLSLGGENMTLHYIIAVMFYLMLIFLVRKLLSRT